MMKVFLDTNVFIEYFERRELFETVSDIFDAIEDGRIEAVISSGSLYTITYLLTIGLKRMNIHRPEQTEKLRSALNGVLDLATVVDISHTNMSVAINDKAFSDIEDSFQYHCALQNKCTHLITINLKDYKKVDSNSIEVLSPMEFVNQAF